MFLIVKKKELVRYKDGNLVMAKAIKPHTKGHMFKLGTYGLGMGGCKEYDGY